MPVDLETGPKWEVFRGESEVFSHVITYPRLYAGRSANTNTKSITGYSIFGFGIDVSHLSSVAQQLYRSSTVAVRTLTEPFHTFHTAVLRWPLGKLSRKTTTRLGLLVCYTPHLH
jgi:hypothetical protein